MDTITYPCWDLLFNDSKSSPGGTEGIIWQLKWQPTVDSGLAPSQWETSLQSNPISHRLGTNQESALEPFFFFFLYLHLYTENKRSSIWQLVVTGGTVSCRNDNLRCHQWRQSCQIDNLLFSVYTHTAISLAIPLIMIPYTLNRRDLSRQPVAPMLGYISMQSSGSRINIQTLQATPAATLPQWGLHRWLC